MDSIYTFDGIEFTKEQYKILKQFYKSKALAITGLKSYASEHTISAAVRFLFDNNLIVLYFDYDLQEIIPDKYCITEYGAQAYELICQHKHEFINRLMLSKISDVIVAFIVALLTGLNADKIWAFLSELIH